MKITNNCERFLQKTQAIEAPHDLADLQNWEEDTKDTLSDAVQTLYKIARAMPLQNTLILTRE